MPRQRLNKRPENGNKRRLKRINNIVITMLTWLLILQAVAPLSVIVNAVTTENSLITSDVSEQQGPAVSETTPPAEIEPLAESSATPPPSASQASEVTAAPATSTAASESKDEPISLTAITNTNINVTVAGMQSDFSTAEGEITVQVHELVTDAATDQAQFDQALAALNQVLPDEKAAARDIRLFDIDLYQNGELIEPVKPVAVTFSKVLAGKTFNEIKVHHIDGNANEILAENVSALADDLNVRVDHFSLYSVTALSDPVPVESEVVSSETSPIASDAASSAATESVSSIDSAAESTSSEVSKTESSLEANSASDSSAAAKASGSATTESSSMTGSKLATEPTMLMQDITPMAVGDISAQNYFPATGISINGHYEAKGIYIDNSGNLHVLIYKVKSDAATQEGFYSPTLNGIPSPLPGTTTAPGFQPYWTNLGLNATVILPGGQTIPIGALADPAKQVRRIYDFNFGPMINYLQATNTLQILNTSGGFNIEITNLQVNIAHTITKTVNKTVATIGDELIYTIAVTNTGNFTLSGVNVKDTVPAGLTIVGVSTDGNNYSPVTVTNNEFNLQTGLTLLLGATRTYYVKAYLNENVTNDQKLLNTASTGGNVPTKSATAEVTAKTTNIAVKKFITGNLGEVSAKFPFTVTVTKNNYYGPKIFTFSLGNNETYNLQKLPTDGVITLEETSGDYALTVKVDGQPITATNGKYIINIANMVDKTITVTNDRTVVIDTGVNLDNMPFLIILMLTVISFLMIVIKKYRLNNK